MGSGEAGHASRRTGAPKLNRTKKRRQGVRIDMTPMVDVAFLLLTFFMLTTSLMGHQIMEINLPPGSREVPYGNVLFLRVSNENVVYWNIGLDIPVKIALDSLNDLVTRHSVQNPNLITLLKVDRKARYHSIIDLLDEIQMAKMGRFSIAPMEEGDREMLKKLPS
ncbi:MAG TPA: biopolymer transporter ExbD [Bacteroidota bacterium]|jgi:biopolymer transport protein ExbD|nr:biopolymer transporter ExbD [Bacteroidota bacterium]